MHEEIISFLRSRPEGTPSRVIAETFLKFKCPDEKLAHIAVNSILQHDKRCTLDSNNMWFASIKKAVSTPEIGNLPWVATYVLTSSIGGVHKAHHISIWELFPEPTCIRSCWITDPSDLPTEERLLLASHQDEPFNSDINGTLEGICQLLQDKIAVYFSYAQSSILNLATAKVGVSTGDESYLLSQLLKVSGKPTKRSSDLTTLAEALLGTQSTEPSSAYKKGELFANVIKELLLRLKQEGFETIEEIDASLAKRSEHCFSGKEFNARDLAAIPERAGVYGFKNKSGEYIYIGKAKNLRRRLTGYFRESEESPKKLTQLREEAHSFTIHLCGSELEALLYENRLINKYFPALNRQTEVNERKGTYIQIDDCIILLPHADSGKGMSFWFRSEQKIKIRAFASDFSERDTLVKELDAFFFAEKLPVDSRDFPELEIAYRWIRRNRDSIISVPVNNYGNSTEIIRGMQGYWRELSDTYRAG